MRTVNFDDHIEVTPTELKAVVQGTTNVSLRHLQVDRDGSLGVRNVCLVQLDELITMLAEVVQAQEVTDEDASERVTQIRRALYKCLVVHVVEGFEPVAYLPGVVVV